MNTHDAELRKELEATLSTRRDLGPEYEAELVDSFMAKMDGRLEAMVDQRVRRQLAERQMTVARAAGRPDADGPRFGSSFGLAMFSLILAVPLSAVAAVNSGLPGLLVAWTGIVGVNAVVAHGRLWGGDRRGAAKDQESWD
ncbi:hypothetical protein GL263_06560 [Streptomyces durbertensis]|uniref:Integral membrane protein n=1 Tax=Streptomyces durbertensis TaxID=2448886 RepID=A0ABR6EDT1_9ACTN|nr:hypothetical protein [Streptomyces durbertensis]MBB1243227.1 hypothetical protein [Streptomyces durbertensis]